MKDNVPCRTVLVHVKQFMKVIIALLIFAVGWHSGRISGVRKTRAALPSCFYIGRATSAPRPYGCDSKEGIDIGFDNIDGGGIYVSLERWK